MEDKTPQIKPQEPDLEPDAWDRFEKAVDRVVKPPQESSIKKKAARKIAKK